ncbi:hypothetical protein ABZ342_28835 [Amycolatopsis sp. NPDC005961]|uniref:hypothetical protein n=1 Tax=Amycolatopsis sp. NPDC005961 TaxID=3156720 RepID=UPI0033F8C0DA
MSGWSDPSALAVFVIAVALLLAAGTSGALRLPPLNVHGPLTPAGIKVTAALGVLCLAVAGGVALWGGHDSPPQPTATPPLSSSVPQATSPSSSETPGSTAPTRSTGSPPSPGLTELAADRVSLGTSTGYDFDTGKTGFAGEGADIVVDSTGISAVSDTALALSGRTDTRPDGCPSELRLSRVPRSGTASGRSVCALTTSGNLAVFTFSDSRSSGEVVVDYVLWGNR